MQIPNAIPSRVEWSCFSDVIFWEILNAALEFKRSETIDVVFVIGNDNGNGVTNVG